MKYNKKEQLFDKIRGLEFVSPDEYGAKYNKGVREAKAIVVSFFNKELVLEMAGGLKELSMMDLNGGNLKLSQQRKLKLYLFFT